MSTAPTMIAPELSFDELVENFGLMDDWDDRYRYLIDLGRKLPAFPDDLKVDAHKVRGCMSQVWLMPGRTTAGTFAFAADSDAHIVKGLIAVLGILYSGKPAAEAAQIDAEAAFGALGLDQHLSPSRRNGLVAMVGKLKQYAAAA